MGHKYWSSFNSIPLHSVPSHLRPRSATSYTNVCGQCRKVMFHSRIARARQHCADPLYFSVVLAQREGEESINNIWTQSAKLLCAVQLATFHPHTTFVIVVIARVCHSCALEDRPIAPPNVHEPHTLLGWWFLATYSTAHSVYRAKGVYTQCIQSCGEFSGKSRDVTLGCPRGDLSSLP